MTRASLVKIGFWTVVACEWAVFLPALAVTLLLGLTILDTRGPHPLPMLHTVLDWIDSKWFDPGTVYGPTYSEEAFQHLRIGTPISEVRLLLGEPLTRRSLPEGEMWYYARHGSASEDYLCRTLEFGSDGRLASRHSEYYWD